MPRRSDRRCECGRPAVALVATGNRRSRKARAGQPRHLAGHWFCLKCWRRFLDSTRNG